MPSGIDWRTWYFNLLKEAHVFLPLLSATYMKSEACYSETDYAKKNRIPVVACTVDPEGWSSVMNIPIGTYDFYGTGTGIPHDFTRMIETYQEYMPGSADTAGSDRTAVTAEGRPRGLERRSTMRTPPPVSIILPSNRSCFMDLLFENMIKAANCVIPHLPVDNTLYGVLVCAPEQEEFAQSICNDLCAKGLRTELLSTDQPSEIPVCTLPVLSAEFCMNEFYFHSMQLAHHHNTRFVPIVHSLSAYSTARTTTPDERMKLSFVNSIFNRANRIPANADFDQNRQLNISKLIVALQAHVSRDMQKPQKLLESRLPKFAALLGSVKMMPSGGGVFAGHENELNELGKRLVEEEQQCLTNVLTIMSHDGTDAVLELAERIRSHLESIEVLVTLLNSVQDTQWFVKCEGATHCVVLLSSEYLHNHQLEGQLTFAKDWGEGGVFAKWCDGYIWF